MPDRPGYASPTAFRRALTDRLQTLATSGPWTLAQLQRQFAYDRLLERLYLTDDGWIVKGATALLARDIGVRGTRDVDVFRQETRDVAEADLRRAAALQLSDWFRFEVGPARPVAAGAPGIRLPITAYVGTTTWSEFGVDLVGTDLHMTGTPDNAPALARVGMPDVEQHGYRVYPIVDHIADKIVATLQRYGSGGVPSTRYKDLVDLVAIVTAVSVSADPQKVALRSEAKRRSVVLPKKFDVPDRPLWGPGYARAAAESLLPTARTLGEALDVVRPFVDALLDDTAQGHWDHNAHGWMA